MFEIVCQKKEGGGLTRPPVTSLLTPPTHDAVDETEDESRDHHGLNRRHSRTHIGNTRRYGFIYDSENVDVIGHCVSYSLTVCVSDSPRPSPEGPQEEIGKDGKSCPF